jgi:hypothetical protein
MLFAPKIPSHGGGSEHGEQWEGDSGAGQSALRCDH